LDGDGMWVFKGKFTSEQGALIEKALEGAESECEDCGHVSAETLSLFKAIITKMA